ncbi:unnamed protein product [Nezara viridula]|uniref:Checkpoint protein n=1 Tax=Nezara viridula TaxID=85310 RepID=A0A9P0E6Z7_NEZVI|nr:unnamed protein product [Nezara viridula]
MKFKAVMYESLSMKNLSFLGNTLNKLTKNCVLRLTKAEMSFLVCEENSSPKQISLWCFIDARQYFNEFIVEAMGPTCEIFLEFPTDMFSSSLSSLKTGNSSPRSVKIKLTNKVSPCLTVDIDLVSDIGMSRTCVHDIPVKVLPRLLWSEYNDPPSHNYNIIIELKNLKKVRSVVERLKKLCSYVELKPSNDGLLSVSGSTQTVTVNTIFKNVLLIEAAGDAESNVRVDAKKLYSLLCCEVLNPKKISCSFLESKLVHFILYCDLFMVHFYLTTIEE